MAILSGSVEKRIVELKALLSIRLSSVNTIRWTSAHRPRGCDSVPRAHSEAHFQRHGGCTRGATATLLVG